MFTQTTSLTNVSALLDASTSAVLTVSSHISAIIFLNESTFDTTHAEDASQPNYLKSFFMMHIPPEQYPEWTWERSSRSFVATRPDVLTSELKAKAHLVNEKLDIVRRVIHHLNRARYPVRTGIDFQETVYLTKKIQAQAFKDTGYDEKLIINYPYILQYADFAQIPLQQAADDILFKAKLDDNLLAKTELLRLKYFQKIKKAVAPSELKEIWEGFIRESYRNALT